MLQPMNVFAAFIGFGNLALAGGLAAASIPIIIHLLNRRKFRETTWAAMRFLLAAIRKNQRRIKIEQWLLLAIRTLILLFLAIAMLKPFLQSSGSLPVLPGQRTHRTIVLDGSMSMAFTPEGESSRFEQAKSLSANLLSHNAKRGDVISIVIMGDPPRIVIRDPSPHHAEVLKELAEIPLPHGGTDLAASFQAIDRVLASSDIPQKELIILTDLQTASWRSKGGRGDDALKRAIKKLESHQPRSVVVDLGRSGDQNAAVVDLKLDSPIVTVGAQASIRGLLKNFGPEAERSVVARLMIDGRYGPEQPVKLPLGVEIPVDFNPDFSSPGDHLVELQIDEDELTLDDKRRLSIPVREFLRVLLVDGDFKPEPYKAETDLLSQALAPEAESTGSPSLIHTEVVSESQIAGRDLAPYDCVILCNVARYSEAEAAALREYLKQGGGVVVFGGDQVEPSNYNRYLFADGKGILPAELGKIVGDERSRDTTFTFNPLNFRHPIVEAFAGAGDEVVAGLTHVATRRYFQLKVPPDSAAKVALAFNNGDPAIVEGSWGRGVVYLIATTADLGWTGWPIHPSFPPVMEQIVLRASAGKLTERNVSVGGSLDLSFPAQAVNAPATVVLPDNRSVNLKLAAGADASRFHFEQTDLSGAYRVRVGAPVGIDATFAANPPAVESDLAKLDRAGLAETLGGWNFAYYTNLRELIDNPSAVGRRGELHRPFLYAVLILLLVESIAAWKFGHYANQGIPRAPRRAK